MLDSENAARHVFDGQEPITKEGRDLMPGILLARCLLAVLRGRGSSVWYVWVSSEQNFAHHIAKAAQRHRFETRWRVDDDVWVHPLRDSWKGAFRQIGLNRRVPGGSGVYALSTDVLHSLSPL